MARRNEGILDILTTLPWWVSVTVSLSAYIGLKYVVPSLATDNIYLQGFQTALPNVAHIFALLLLIPAPISAFNAWRKRKLLDNHKNIQTIRDLSWREFELLVAEAYRRQGYSVIENDIAGPDGGIDVRLKKLGALHIVQCKNWKSVKVGVKVVREMYGVMVAEQASSVKIIISGMFTQEAKNFANDKPIDLIDGAQLETLIANVQVSTPHINSTPTPTPTESITPTLSIKTMEESKSCPKCSNVLILRTAKKGKNAGGQFWGCSSYPKCRHTQSA
jgi:restriction system protein